MKLRPMKLSNRTVAISWVGLLLVIVAGLGLAGTPERHALHGVHQELRAIGQTVSYVLSPMSASGDKSAEVQPDSQGRLPLTVVARPAGATIRVMNIGPVYQPGIALMPGDYDIEVSAPGYRTERRWVELSRAATQPRFTLQPD